MKTCRITSLIPLLFAVLCCSCQQGGNNEVAKENLNQDSLQSVEVDLGDIREKDTLKAITVYSSTSYFIYRGQPMGYEYELLQRLADHLNLELDIVIADNLDNMFRMLKEGKGDIVAHGLTITKERKKVVDFTEPHLFTRQVLVQKKPENWRRMKLHNIEDQLIRRPVELIGKTVYVRKNTSYYSRLQNLSEEIGGDINIETVPGNLETDKIIQWVAEDSIEYTVADEHIAKINKTYYPVLDIDMDISFSQRIAWAVRKTSPELLKAINNWIKEMKQKPAYYTIRNKYFKNTKAFRRRIKSDFYSRAGGKISKYDESIRKYAENIKWDWRLMASLVYQESKFDPKARSWAGAKGLLQMMPRTAEDYGISGSELYDPEKSLKAGSKYLDYLERLWKEIPDSLERKKFVMASYNVGQGHVADARRLTRKYGGDPDKWKDNVAKYLLLKSRKQYYSDPVVKYGYCRGAEPYHYVKDIIKRYNHYRKFISLDAEKKDNPEEQGS